LATLLNELVEAKQSGVVKKGDGAMDEVQSDRTG